MSELANIIKQESEFYRKDLFRHWSAKESINFASIWLNYNQKNSGQNMTNDFLFINFEKRVLLL